MHGEPGAHAVGSAGAAPRIEMVEDRERLAALAEAWDSLAARDPGCHVFQSHPWLSTWLKHYPSAHPVLAVAWRGDVLTAAIPLCAYDLGRLGLRVRSLRFAADLNSDYCDALSDPAYPDDLATLWGSVIRRRDWHVIDLRYMLADSRLAAVASRTPARGRMLRQQQDVAPYMDIREDWRERVSRDHRTEVLRRQRRAREQGQVSFEVAATPEDADEMLGQLAEMHIARWRNRRETSVFRFDEHRAWVGELCHELLARQQLYLCRLAMDGRPMSIALGFLTGRRILRYTSTFDEGFSRFGPVHLLLMAVVEDLRARDAADVHDFGRGNEPYKGQWTQQAQRVDRLLIARNSPIGLLSFWWSGYLKAFLWSHPALGTFVREARRRLSLRRARTGK